MTFKKTHGMTSTREYRAWQAMRDRCSNPSTRSYKNYGGRGINVCERWQTFENFHADMGPCNGLQLERRHNDGDYEPGNCIWATAKAQGNNRRTNRWIEIGGETRTLQQWADHYGLRHDTCSRRIENGIPLDRPLQVHR